MKKVFFLVCYLTLLSISTMSQTPTWSDKVARLIYDNCAECHHAGGIAPLNFDNYNDASTYASSIKSAVLDRRMPPWMPNSNYQHFKGERVLEQNEINDIVAWANGGAPAGNLGTAPVPPVFSNGAKMNPIDKTVTIPTYSVASNTDVYRCFVIPSGNSVAKYISQVEFMPANQSIVHHILLYQDTSGVCQTLDNNDPLPGYSSSGGGVGASKATLIGGWVPGGNLIDIPSGMGIRLAKNADFVIQIHYAPGSLLQRDSTSINFKYATSGSIREVYVAPVLNHVAPSLINGPLFIPANTVKSFTQKYTLPSNIDISLISVAPHMHLIGRTYKVYGVKSAGDTMPMIHIPAWDFHWQGAYTFQRIMKVPRSTVLWGEASYDNTPNNPFQPNSPPTNVFLGEGTNDEMMLVYFTYTLYQPGDENIVLDSSIFATGINAPILEKLAVFPNPTKGSISLSYLLNAQEAAEIIIYDLTGRILFNQKQLPAVGLQQMELSTDDLPVGMYLINIKVGSKNNLLKFFKE